MKKYVSLVLAVIIFFFSFGSHAVYAQNENGRILLAGQSNDVNGDDESDGAAGEDSEEEDSEEEDSEEEDSEEEDSEEEDSAGNEEAVISDVSAEYDLVKQCLNIEWSGNAVSYVEVYLDNAEEPDMTSAADSSSCSIDIDWEPLSKHTFKLVPYGTDGVAGNAKTGDVEVDDYTAVIDSLDVEYIQESKQIHIEWSGTNVEYVDLYMNDEVLAEKYTGEEYNLQYVPQAGASYVITVNPYSENGTEGDGAQETLVEGEFSTPEISKLTKTSSNIKDEYKNYTGFCRPAVNIQWTAEANSCYEIYRAATNTTNAYSCIARVNVAKGGAYTYKDNNAKIGTNYYAVRQIITQDTYIEQELLTALSEAKKTTVKLTKPGVSVNLTADGTVMLSMDGKEEFVSGYAIFCKKNGSYEQIAEVTGNVYIDSNTKFGKQYTYKVKSFYYDKKTKKKYYSAAVKVKAKNTVGSFTMQARQTAQKKVTVSWDAAANADGYEVYYKTSTVGDSYNLLKTTDALSLSMGIKAGLKYSFLVKAYKKGSNHKVYFSTAETELETGFTGPNNFRVSKTTFHYDSQTKSLTRKDKLAWDKVYGAKGYYIDVYNPATKKFKVLKQIKGSDQTSCVVSNNLPSAAGNVIYRIRSYSGKNKVDGESLEIELQMGQVSGVHVSKSGDSAKVSWEQTTGAESYRVYRSNGRSCVLVGTTAQLSFTDKGLSSGVTYSYYVQAVNDTLKMEGAYSVPVAYTKKLLTVGSLRASAFGSKNVELTWSSEKGASGHIIYYRKGNSGKYKVLARVSGNRTYYTHKNVTEGAVYYYKVTRLEINAGGVETESAAKKVNIKVQ